MSGDALLILLIKLALGYPICYLVVHTGSCIAHRCEVPRRRIARSAVILWLLASLLDFALIQLSITHGVEMPVFYGAVLVWAGALLFICAVFTAVFNRLTGPTGPGRAILAVLCAAFMFMVVQVATGTLIYLTFGAITEYRYELAMDEYHAVQLDQLRTSFAGDGIPLVPGVTDSVGDGENTSFSHFEQYPDLNANDPDDWHTHFPPEKLYMLHSTAAPDRIESGLIDDLHRAGFSVYYHPNQPGSGLESVAGPYIAGYKNGIFVQYKLDILPANLPTVDTTVWQSVWRRYSGEIHGLALKKMQPRD